MENANQQTPATVNQISNAKPRIERSFRTAKGDIGGSLNGGHNRTIAWFRVMAGTKIESYKLPIKLKMLTPLSPAYQKLTAVANFYFVPDKRVFEESEEYYAQAGGTSKTKITKKPTLQGKKIPYVPTDEQSKNACLTETTLWRDTIISDYIPRVGYFELVNENEHEWARVQEGAVMPDYDACLLRGRIAIWNDFERNKQYEPKAVEYKGNTVSETEWQSYLPFGESTYMFLSMRARRNNSYYMDYRVDAQGYEIDPYDALQAGDEKAMVSWANVESQLAELRSQAENAEKNPWDIINEIYGTSRKLSEGKVQLLKRYTFPLNYASVTQNTYNNNTSIEPEYRVMGQQGAYSYTEEVIQGPQYWEAIEPGYIHVILTITADSVFERAFERTAMNVNWDDEYRPDMKDQKLDTLNYLEVESHIGANGIIGGGLGPIGFKRKWNEYSKLPNVVKGDMTTFGYFQTGFDDHGYPYSDNGVVLSQGTHQFYEENVMGIGSILDDTLPLFYKDYYKDYTDLLINKNQAYKNDVTTFETYNNDIMIRGQNQIFYAGEQIAVLSLPIDDTIASNFTNWGEH